MANDVPYSFTAYKPIDIVVDGQHVVLRTGDKVPFADPCAAVRFVNALVDQTGGSYDDNTQTGIDQMQEACTASGGGPGGLSPPQPPAPIDDPGTTDPAAGDPQAAGDHSTETPQTLGAPAPETSGAAESASRDPGESDGRPLGQQYRAPQDPMPDHDVVQLLQDAGLTGSDLSDALQAVEHNDPLPGLPHHWFGRDDSFPLATVADPVLAFTGQYALVVTDVSIASEPLPLHLTRTYTSGEVSFGPFGYNWDHNYNCYLRPLTNGRAAVWTGARTEEVHTQLPAPGADGLIEFEPPTGIFRKLRRHPADAGTDETYYLSDREGLTQVFTMPAGWPYGDRLPLTRIEDRHGRAHELLYNAEGRLERVRDAAGRFLRFAYGDCGLLEWMEDNTARRWSYGHADDIEHLVAVTTPPVTDQPNGMTTRYGYDDWRTHPALIHNLVTVIDADDRLLVRNVYGDDPMSDDFARVVFQEYGDWSATFAAERLQYVPRVPEALNVPALRVSVVDPGILKVYTFNYRGDLLDERFRLVIDGSYRLVARTYRYDEQGNMIERREPNGLGMAFVHDAANPDPRARGNLLRAELLAPPTRPSPSRIVLLMTYEPRFHRLKTVKDEKGRITTWDFDYETLPGGTGEVVAIRYPDVTLPDGTTATRRETFKYDGQGRMTAHVTGAGHRHEFAYGASGPSQGFLTQIIWDALGAAEQATMEHDAAGRRVATVDGLGNRTELTYDALDRLTEIRRPGPAGEEIRFRYTVDGKVSWHERPRGHFDDGVIAGSMLIDTHEYDAWGHRAASVYGANTADPRRFTYRYDGEGRLLSMTDPLGTESSMSYDERGRVLTRVEATRAPEEATTRYVYDLNGNQTRIIDPVGHRVDYVYDAWDRLSRTILPGDVEAERSVITLVTDELDHCTRITIDGLVTPGVIGRLFDAGIEYDQRGRPWRRTAGGLVTTTTHDADERAVIVEDQRGGRTTFTWDGLNRAVAAQDPGGNAELRTYDAAGSLIELITRELTPTGPQDCVTTFAYDARRRPVSVTSPLGSVATFEYDARDLTVASVNPLGLRTERDYGAFGELLAITGEAAPGAPVTTRMRFDANGRLLEQIDGEGGVTRYGYDRRDRRTSITYPDGRTHRFFYSVRRQLESETLPSGTIRRYGYGGDAGMNHIEVTPAGGVAATARESFFNDGLRRVVRAEQDGHVLERRYDEVMRLTREAVDGRASEWRYDDAAGIARFTYPDGRVDRLETDPLRRPVRLTLETPGADALTGGLGAGAVLSRWTYAGTARLIDRVAANGVTTRIDYDAALRPTALVHKDAGGTDLATVRIAYDAADRRRVIWMSPAPQRPRRLDLDGLSRLVAVADDLALAPPPADADQARADTAIAAAEAAGAPTVEYQLNGADSRTHVRRNTGAIGDDAYALDAAWQLSDVTRTGVGAGVIPYAFDADGRCILDQRYRYLYDGFDRLVEVQDLAGATLLRQEHDPAGRVLKRTAGGSSRLLDHHGMRLVGWREGGGGGQLSYGLGLDDVTLAATGSIAVPLLDTAASVLAWTDDAGAVTERYRYDAFGSPSAFAADGVTVRANPTVEPGPAFGGHRLLVPFRYDARARVFDPETGRFLTPDPLGYPDAGNLYVYVHHDPADLVDPTGEVALLLGLAVAAGVGLLAGIGTNAVRQGLQIHEGSRDSFSWGEMLFSGAVGAVAGPVLVLVPELAIPLAAYGAGSGAYEISQGHYESGAFDIATSILPFASKNVRGAAMGRGSVFSPARGLGPAATGAERAARFGELGTATKTLAGRLWNERFFHGTTHYAALESAESGVNTARVRDAHLTNPSPPAHGPGLYFGREPGAPDIPGSPQWWADLHGGGRGGSRGGGPAVLEASVPRWRAFLLRRQPGVLIDSPQQGFTHPASAESVFPLGGPRGTPPTGPGAEFNAIARYRLWDPDAIAPSLTALWPALSSPVPWMQPPGRGGVGAAPATSK